MAAVGGVAQSSPAGAVGTGTVRLDGRGLTPADVAAVARGGTRARLTPEAIESNQAAAAAVAAILARGDPVYGVTTGVGVLRTREVDDAERPEMPLRLLRSHAGGGGALLPREVVRAAM